MIRAAALFTLLALGPSVAGALEMPLGARLLSERIAPLDSYALPVAPFDGARVPAQVIEGQVERRTWRIDGGSSTPLQLLAPLRDQLRTRRFEILFECRARDCGGFDFRFGTEIAPAPQMFVDIGNFWFLSAVRNGNEVISLLVSRAGTNAYIQEIQVVPAEAARRVEPTAADREEDQPEPADTVETEGSDGQEAALIDRLFSDGHAILEDLDFETGSNTLGPGAHDSLARIAAFLVGHPAYRIVLVGHTDSVGALETNIALSKRRAEAVRGRLIDAYGVPAGQVGAEGMGYLAPVASNLTPEGRERNRRVEALLLPVE